MFVFLSKLLDVAVAPVTWVLLLLALALVNRARGRSPVIPVAAALAVLYVFSAGPFVERLTRLAERGAARTYRPDAVYDAAILLTGFVDAPASRVSGHVELTAAADRITRTLELWREGRLRTIVVAGGNVTPTGDPPEAERVAERLRAWGVPADRIVVEPRSRNTRENAVETARVVAERDLRALLLVTSALHMPRALGCFRAVGLSPDALPVDHRGGDSHRWLPRASALDEATDVLRELTGRVVYWVAGYTR